MARKATDLLDVFRFNEEDADEDAARGKREGARRAAKTKRDAKRSTSPRAQGEGLKLNRRQVVLGASAVSLLLVLSFVLGLSTGRGGRSAGDAAALSATTARYFAIRGSIPLVDHTTQKPVDPGQVAEILKRDYGLQRDQIVLRRSGDQLVIEVGPFPSMDKARAYHRASGLELLHLHMADPFRWPEFTPWGEG